MRHPNVESSTVAGWSVEQRVEMVRVLQLAALELWDGAGDKPYTANHYVCHAVLKTNCHPDMQLLVSCWIGSQLNNCASLVAWLVEKGLINSTHFGKPEYQTTIQQLRHTWIAAMVNYLELCNENT